MELYIHIPFCVRKCNYCDFLSFPCGNEVTGKVCTEEGCFTADEYVNALCDELNNLKTEYSGRHFTSAFIGGGTPSVLSEEQTELILAAAGRLMNGAPAEYTIECNPGTVDAGKMALYRKYGINRISFGLQSVNNDELAMLGRIHSYEQFLESYRLAREAGFDNINIDLISAIPGQSVESWERTLRTVAELKPEHISAYSLIIEPGTRFWDIYGDDVCCTDPGVIPLPDEDSEREMYRLTKDILAGYGFGRYEISNYAAENRRCAHNLGYWTGEEYIGTGLGASSYIKSDKAMRYKNTDSLKEYLLPVSEGGRGSRHIEVEVLTEEEQMSEYMFLHLRLTDGFDTDDFKNRFGIDVFEKYGDIIDKYIKFGFMIRADQRVMLTESGLDISNTIMAEFV